MKQPHPASLLAALAALLALGCASARGTAVRVVKELNPVATYEVNVMSATPRGPYLDARLVGTDFDLTLLFPASDLCARLVQAESALTWVPDGSFGAVRDDEGSKCSAVGVASLAAWRDRFPQRRVGPTFPRETARYRVIHRDEDAVLVRGRFPLAGLVKIPGGNDLVAVIPNSEACQAALARSESSLEFRDTGPVPYRLGSGDGSCPVQGFAIPPAVAAGPPGAP